MMTPPPPARSSRTPRRSIVWTARAFALLFSIVLGAGAAEILLRAQASAVVFRPAKSDPEAAGLPDIEGIRHLARPNQRARYRGALFTTNSRGLRGPEYSRDKPPGTFRIEMLGDSFTMGSGVRANEAYPALIEEALHGTEASRHVEVMNLGLSGLSLAGSIDVRLQKIGLDYSPDMLVYGFTLNDLEGPDYRPLRRPPPAPSRSMLFQLLHERWNYLRDILWPSQSSYVRELHNNFFENPAVWQRFESDLDRLAAVARERNLCVVVLLHTQLTALHAWHPFLPEYAAVAEAARARGFFVADSFPWYSGVDPNDYVCGPYDPHPNALGHQVLSEVLLASLRSLPASCWTLR